MHRVPLLLMGGSEISYGASIPSNSVLWFFIIGIWPFFLGAHFVWAFSLTFLLSGHGYWQEFIESIVWTHNKLKVARATQPRVLSIVQGRAVGVAYYLLGGIFHIKILKLIA